MLFVGEFRKKADTQFKMNILYMEIYNDKVCIYVCMYACMHVCCMYVVCMLYVRMNIYVFHVV
jgi:hypothetical protein